MGSFPGVTSQGHRLLGSDRFQSLTKPRGILRAVTALWPPRATWWAVTAHWAPQCTEAGGVRILACKRDEGWRRGRGEGTTNVHAPCLGTSLAVQHPGLLPQATPLGAIQLGAMHYGCHRATGQPGAEKRGGGDGGDEARTGNPCAPAGQCHRSQRSTGSWAGIVRQLEAIKAPPERRLLGNLKQPEPPPPPLAAGTLFSGLFAMATAIRAPTPQQGQRPQVSGVWKGGGQPGWGPRYTNILTSTRSPRRIDHFEHTYVGFLKKKFPPRGYGRSSQVWGAG